MSDDRWLPRGSDDEMDARLSDLLSELDPGRRDATYWMRFHREGMNRAEFELARRRREAEDTVADIVSGWSRLLVPAALAAAALAGLLLVQPPTEMAGADHMRVEEVLTLGLTEPFPVSAEDVERLPGPDGVLLAAEIY